MAREEIRCHGKLQAEIDIEQRKLYLWCKHHHVAEGYDLQPYLDRMLAQEAEGREQDEGQAPVRLLRVM
jgi:hypothetical protein